MIRLTTCGGSHCPLSLYALILDQRNNEIHYFTGGCAGTKIIYKDDYNLECEWNFFATSHGKSVCDGIGGTVKRLLTKASLQRPYTNPILTTDAIMDKNIPGIIIITPADIQQYEVILQERLVKQKQ